jgi:hypothetical protein
MAVIFAHALSALANIISNGVASFTIFGLWDETECPEEML